MNGLYAVTLAAVSALASGLAALFGSYAKRKGENLATKEDFRELKAQAETLTEATKRIEASISHDLWNRQKQWELKRDYLLAALEPIGAIDGMMIELLATIPRAADPATVDREFFVKRRNEAAEEWHRQMKIFDERRRILLMICGKTVSDTFLGAGREIRETGTVIFRQNPEDVAKLGLRVQAARESVYEAARIELGLGSPN